MSSCSADQPWRRLAAKVVERAVLGLVSGRQPAWERTAAAAFLLNPAVRALCDVWGLWLPWNNIRALARHHALTLSLPHLWQAALDHLRHQPARATFNIWLKGTTRLDCEWLQHHQATG
ncbi:MAG: hypothetical protein ACE5G8_02745 [Anaerolineae bacterium]